MDAYAAAWGRLADRVWRREYPQGKLRLLDQEQVEAHPGGLPGSSPEPPCAQV